MGIIRVAGILLAAGTSTRFGANKLLHPLADGTPVALAAAQRLKAALPDALAVVRPGDDALQRLFAQAGLRVIFAPRAAEGMGASLAAGVAAAHDASGWIVALADMPFILPDTVRAVAQALEAGAAIAAPQHDGRRGHPVGFAGRFRDTLLALDGDAGAHALLARHAAEVRHIAVADRGVLLDIDTPADVAAA